MAYLRINSGAARHNQNTGPETPFYTTMRFEVTETGKVKTVNIQGRAVKFIEIQDSQGTPHWIEEFFIDDE